MQSNPTEDMSSKPRRRVIGQYEYRATIIMMVFFVLISGSTLGYGYFFGRGIYQEIDWALFVATASVFAIAAGFFLYNMYQYRVQRKADLSAESSEATDSQDHLGGEKLNYSVDELRPAAKVASSKLSDAVLRLIEALLILASAVSINLLTSIVWLDAITIVWMAVGTSLLVVAFGKFRRLRTKKVA